MEVFRREGDHWTVVYRGATARIAGMKGMGYLARLLADPGREFHALDLVTAQGVRRMLETLPPGSYLTLCDGADAIRGEAGSARPGAL